MLQWVFGRVLACTVHVATAETAAGYLELERARVRWFLSIDARTLPSAVRAKGQRTYRCISVDGHEVEFSEGFTDLHTETYSDILAGGGYRLADARPAIELVHRIRHATVGVSPERTSVHPLVDRVERDRAPG